MANFYYSLPSDEVEPDAVTTDKTEDTDYPLSNAIDWTPKNIANPGKIVETSGRFTFDNGAAQRMDWVVIQINAEPGDTVAVQANATDSWGSPTLDTSFVMPARQRSGYVYKVWVDLRQVSGYTTSGFRYLSVNVASGSGSDPLGIKVRILSAPPRQLDAEFLMDPGVEDSDFVANIFMQSDGGAAWPYDTGHKPRARRGNCAESASDLAKILDLFHECAGRVETFVVVPDPAATIPDAWVVRLWFGQGSIEAPNMALAGLVRVKTEGGVYRLQLGWMEETAGDPEW